MCQYQYDGGDYGGGDDCHDVNVDDCRKLATMARKIMLNTRMKMVVQVNPKP